MIEAVEGHSVKWTISRGWVQATFTCHEPPGAECKQTCPEGCEQWESGHEHPLVPIKECNALTFFENADEPDYGYVGGPDDQPLVSGPIDIEWTGDGYGWSYPAALAVAPEPTTEEPQ